jgi:2-keto-4-pentenoate hydratase/2-oxohepta-3-ene-1,7-dioic acid hydratase in catechol pathway
MTQNRSDMMKLLRYGPKNQEKPGLLDHNNYIRDLSGKIKDLSGEVLLPDTLSKLADIDPNSLPLINTNPRIGPCVAGVGKFICIGLNYKDHAHETGVELPKEPVVFSKATSAISGPFDEVIIPRGSYKTDWEVELGVIIGKPAKYIHEKNALDYVAGYCVINDLSERAFQLEGTGQWIKGKSCDTFGPIGPFLVTKDEIPDPQNLELWLEVDGHRYQQGHTKNMAFSVAYLISYLSHFFTLYPGDIISTGTPAGVGLGIKPNPIYLKPGQTIRLGITGLGEQRQKTIKDI